MKEITRLFGYQQITSLSSATALTVPEKDVQGIGGAPHVAVIIAETQSVRWRDDGVDPSATVGMPLAAGTSFVYDGDLKRIKFFEQAASAKLNVTYYA